MTEPTGTKERIMKVAFDLFSRRSYATVSMDDIAREAGVSKGGLFHHFPTKYVLGRECLFAWIESMMGDYSDPEYRRRTTSGKRISDLLDLAETLPGSEIQYFRFFLDLYGEALDDPDESAHWKGFIRDYVELLSYDMADLGASEPRMRALIMLATLDGLGLYYPIVKDEDWIDRKAIRDELKRMFNGE